ncbi:cytochrome P450 [Lophiotrema nucula]|uniref:Cytochrome P450 n=1 Tax=Lophiotrema nucula TaxID=690887 RepID=A0A6A5ZIV1_9PLEO|nr:cytochrome P450 [Lophiotrema nucula]
MAQIVILCVAFLAIYFLRRRLFSRKDKQLPLPPGPSGLPLVGNIQDLPAPGAVEFQHWLRHKDLYGPISSVTVLGQTMIIIHDKDIALELMEKRASIHSGRPKMKFGFDLVGWINTMSSLQYGHTHRLYRKYAYQQLGSKAVVSKYWPLQEAVVGRALWRIYCDNGGNLTKHLKTEVGELILKLVYGYTIEPKKNDPLVDRVDEVMEQFSEAVVPGRWLVDIIPSLEHLPEWLPGAGFKRTARLWRKTLMDCVSIPYEYVKQQKKFEKSERSLVSSAIDQAVHEKTLDSEVEHAIKWTAVSLYTGGADTSVIIMSAFFLAMSMHPDVQRKAQEEIDRVVGTSRLPTFGDRENLPYINAIVDEAQRWHPLAVMGLPHASDKEDTINGYRIPKGSLLLPAVWWYTRDPEVYHNPEAFKPERYFEPYSEPSATTFTWGFGRRICPGRVLADSSLYLTFVQALALFDIRCPIDDNGKGLKQLHDYESGLLCRPKPFKVVVRPRSKEHEITVQRIIERYPFENSGAGQLQSIGL